MLCKPQSNERRQNLFTEFQESLLVTAAAIIIGEFAWRQAVKPWLKNRAQKKMGTSRQPGEAGYGAASKALDAFLKDAIELGREHYARLVEAIPADPPTAEAIADLTKHWATENPHPVVAEARRLFGPGTERRWSMRDAFIVLGRLRASDLRYPLAPRSLEAQEQDRADAALGFVQRALILRGASANHDYDFFWLDRFWCAIERIDYVPRYRTEEEKRIDADPVYVGGKDPEYYSEWLRGHLRVYDNYDTRRAIATLHGVVDMVDINSGGFGARQTAFDRELSALRTKHLNRLGKAPIYALAAIYADILRSTDPDVQREVMYGPAAPVFRTLADLAGESTPLSRLHL
jgi:hypothetical protein